MLRLSLPYHLFCSPPVASGSETLTAPAQVAGEEEEKVITGCVCVEGLLSLWAAVMWDQETCHTAVFIPSAAGLYPVQLGL